MSGCCQGCAMDEKKLSLKTFSYWIKLETSIKINCSFNTEIVIPAPNFDGPTMEGQDDYNYEDYNTGDETQIGNGTEVTTSIKDEGYLKIIKGLTNITKPAGEGVKLRCEATGEPPPTKFEWLKNEAPIVEEKNRLVARSYKLKGKHEVNSLGTRLKISTLEVHDTGFYTCQISNGIKTVESTGVLKIRVNPFSKPMEISPFSHFTDLFDGSFHDIGLSNSGSNGGFNFDHINGGMKKHNMSLGGTFPNVHTFGMSPDHLGNHFSQNHAPPPDPFEETQLPKGTFHLDDYNSKHIFANPTSGNTKSSSSSKFHNTFVPDLKNDIGKNVVDHSVEPVCQLYRGTRCQKYVGNKTVYIPSNLTQKMLEEKVNVAFTVIENSNDISPGCEAYAEPSLCYSAFPICNSNPSKPPHRICREDCELLENVLCRLEYALAKSHPLIGMQLSLPECEELPEIHSEESRGCLRMGIQKQKQEPYCYWGAGGGYRGTQHLTAKGQLCVPWSYQQEFAVTDYPELVGHNYCRNPGNTEDRPWCFTEYEDRLHRELCDVPQCVSHMWFYILAPCTALMVLFIFWLIYFCCKRRKRNRNDYHRNQNFTTAKIVNGKNSPAKPKAVFNNRPNDNGNLEMNALLPGFQSNNKGQRPHNVVRAREYQLSNVKFLEELGEGAFGKVYKGEVHVSKTEPVLQVAIKTLKENATLKTQQDFRREVELMSELRHPNIVCLLGVVKRQQPYAMLFEYMTQGDLHEYLMLHSPRSADDNGGHILDQHEFLQIALQVAAGMDYLSSHHYVHRDLAARNCLVGDNLTVKISDFGLSRDVYSSDYYRVQSKSLLPVRWMPPESILYGKFTTESDVWSYGVVLWEIYSYGLQPYYGYNNQEVIEMIRSRQLLPCPEDCPSRIYSLMVECWHEVPSRRPHFPELHARLNAWCMESTRVVNYSPNSQGMWSTMDETSFRGTTCSSNSNTSHKSSTNPSNKTQSTQVSGPPVRPQMPAPHRPPNNMGPPMRSFNQTGSKNMANQKYWPLGSNSLPKSSNSSCSGQSSNTNWSNLNLAEEQNHRSQLDKNNFEFARCIEPKNQVIIMPNHRGLNESKISNI
ncbi:hypothetical protein RUM43_012971 [Polyplax serrata]|uniref:Tyrosine-protein kinase receptor n=1 Tax=Polyplax serrata TaxID=468196 RepID=A0AAN8PC90_POLSC